MNTTQTVNTPRNFASIKPRPHDNVMMCWKCSGTGFFCLYVENNQPRSNTGFQCFACLGTGWVSRRPKTTPTTRAFTPTAVVQNILKASSDSFTFSKSTNTFVTDAADLRGFERSTNQIALTSAKTGKTLVFKYVGTDVDEDGDTQAWRFVVRADSRAIAPEAGDLRLVVIND